MTNQIEKLPIEQIEDLGKEGLEEMIREDVQEIQGRGHRLGRCLRVMRDKLFYKPDFDTFENYCEENWGISKRHANQLIVNAGVRADIETYVNKLIEAGEMGESCAQISLLPVIESHCDALSSVARELRGEVWLKANGELKPNEKLTAKKILDVALKCTTEKAPKSSALPPLTVPKPTVKTTVEEDDKPDDFETLDNEPEGDSNQITEPAPPFELTESEPEKNPEATQPEPVRHRYLKPPIGLIGKVSDLKTPDRLFDFAILEIKHLQGMASAGLGELHRLVKDGGRIAIFHDYFAKGAELVEAGVTHDLELEEVFIRVLPNQPDALFAINHQYIFVLRKGQKPKDRLKNTAKTIYDHLNGYPGTVWHGDIAFAAGILVRAYTTPGDRVLCPAGGTELIATALSCGNETHYLTKDQEALAYYRGVFGDEEA